MNHIYSRRADSSTLVLRTAIIIMALLTASCGGDKFKKGDKAYSNLTREDYFLLDIYLISVPIDSGELKALKLDVVEYKKNRNLLATAPPTWANEVDQVYEEVFYKLETGNLLGTITGETIATHRIGLEGKANSKFYRIDFEKGIKLEIDYSNRDILYKRLDGLWVIEDQLMSTPDPKYK